MNPDDPSFDVLAAQRTLLDAQRVLVDVHALLKRLGHNGTNDNGSPEYYTAKTCGMTPTTFKRLCRTGVFAGAARIGREWQAPRRSVDAWREAQASAARAPAGRDDTAPATERSADEIIEAQRRQEADQGKPGPRPRRR